MSSTHSFDHTPTKTSPLSSQGDKTPDRYVLLRQLGAGGMGVVHEAYDVHLARKVAIKRVLLPPSVSYHSEVGRRIRANLFREAQNLAKVSSPFVVTIYDVGVIDSDVYLSMEKLHRQTFRALARANRKHPVEQWIQYYIQAGMGLAAAHRRGLTHRDFKPDNVMLTPDGAKLFDFGLAVGIHSIAPERTAVENRNRSASPESSTTNYLSSVAGTPLYMSPEQHRGHHVDARSDQFSFCASMVESISGRPLFRGLTLSELAKEKSEGLTWSALQKRGCPRWLLPIISKGLSPSASKRFSSMDALLEELLAERQQQKNRATITLSGILLVGSIALAPLQLRPDDSRCDFVQEEADTFTRHLDRWNEPWPDHATVARSMSDFDWKFRGFAQDWRKARLRSCELNQSADVQAKAFSIALAACLDRQRWTANEIMQSIAIGSAHNQNAKEFVQQLRRSSSLIPQPELCIKQAHNTRPELRSSETNSNPAYQQALSDLHDAQSLALRGQTKRAIEAAQAMQTRYAQRLAPDIELDLLTQIGFWYSHAQNYDRSTQYWTKGYELARAQGDDWQSTELASAMIAGIALQGDPTRENVELWSKRAMSSMLRLRSEHHFERSIMANRATALSILGEYEDAETSIRHAIVLSKREPFDHHLLAMYNNWGLMLRRLGRLHEARDALQSALTLASQQQVANETALAFIHDNLGFAYTELGDPHRAIEEHERSLDINHEAFGGPTIRDIDAHRGLLTAAAMLEVRTKAMVHRNALRQLIDAHRANLRPQLIDELEQVMAAANQSMEHAGDFIEPTTN